jgi:hypothetical protein
MNVFKMLLKHNCLLKEQGAKNQTHLGVPLQFFSSSKEPQKSFEEKEPLIRKEELKLLAGKGGSSIDISPNHSQKLHLIIFFF